ncbi:MAG: hypothetical protein GH151_08535, partial [Bacteroidetes bacterium]|nr:hypothetical protein [Bacteroidota bacterium]
MKSKSQLEIHISRCKPIKNSWFFVLLLYLLAHNPLYAQVKGEEKFSIKLKTREFVPEVGIKSETLSKLQHQIVAEKKYPHVMIQFTEIPTSYERELLVTSGIKLLNYIGNNTWYASISDSIAIHFQNTGITKKYPALNLVRSIEEIPVEDKISPQIREKGIGDWARTPDGKVNLVVSYFKDVDIDIVKTRLQTLGAKILGGVKVVNNLTITIEEQKITDIAAEDIIMWIEVVPPPGGPESNRIRAHVQADMAQNAPLNLTGNNVTVGVFEWNHILQNHADFSGRAVRKDATAYDPGHHPTMVAGIIGGNGSQSNANGGTANQWKGMAPGTNLYSYNANSGGTTADDYLDFSNDLETAIGTDNIDIANNSW